MAKAKKKEMTLEEKLEQALVPKEEQPYEVPENWVWTTIGSVGKFIGGGTPSKGNPHYWSGSIPWASVKDIKGDKLLFTQDSITQRGLEESATNLCELDDLIVVTRIEPGKTIIAKTRVAINQDLKIYKSTLSSNFLHLYFSTIKSKLEKKSSGSTVLGITIPNISSSEIPLPPLPEQQRIVLRIESLFKKLDHARELVQSALDSFETRKAAILHKAFTGELTAKWREENGVGLGSWEDKVSGELFEYVTSGSRGWAKYYSGYGTAFLRMGNLDHGTIGLDLSNIQYVTLPDKIEGRRTKLQEGDILLSITADVGMVGVFNGDFDAYINQHIALARPIPDVCVAWLAWFLVSDLGLKQLQKKQRGATKAGLGLEDIKSLYIKTPIFTEQQEIVRILDSLLEKEQQAKDKLEPLLDQIDLLKKSILARAFRGELGTNDPNEESALKLLKEVLAQQAK